MTTALETQGRLQRVVIWGPIRLAGMRRRFRPDSIGTIPELWERFVPHIGRVPGQRGEWAFGACFNESADGAFDYLAGVEIDDESVVSSPLETLHIRPQRYGVFVHDGHVSGLARTWAGIYSHGLTEGGLTAVGAPAFELYDERFDPSSGEGEIEIWVPVER